MTFQIHFVFLFFGLAFAYPFANEKLSLPLSQRLKRGNSLERGRLGIYDGYNSTIKKHPYTIAQYFYWDDGNNVVDELFNCGGVILTDSWVYSDANCFDGMKPKEMFIVAGADYVNDDDVVKNGTRYEIEKIIYHPSFAKRTYYYSFALAKIKGTFQWSDKISKISIASKRLQKNSQVTFSGYGSNGTIIGPFLEGNMTWLNKETCKDMYKDSQIWYDSNVCMYNKGKTTMCEGDYGDPVVHNGLLYGHVVGVDKDTYCSNRALPTVVGDTLHVLPWIQKHIGPVSVSE